MFDVVVPTNAIPLEDELGDVLEKALRRADLPMEEAAQRAGVPLARVRDAIDYRSDLTCAELGRIATVLELNEVGLCALAEGKYPLPEVGGLPFCVHALRMPYGIGVANAYLVSECGSGRGFFSMWARVWKPCLQSGRRVFRKLMRFFSRTWRPSIRAACVMW